MAKIKKVRQIRFLTQLSYLIIANPFLFNLFKGKIYRGPLKNICLPGLSCYSCPSQGYACPVGAFQAVVNDKKFSFSFYVTALLVLFGSTLGRFICGFLCPFGLFQDLLHKIPSKKIRTNNLKILTYVKYLVLLIFVILLPIILLSDVGTSNPYFCKLICPSGILTAAIPLSVVNESIRASLGSLFIFKFSVLVLIIAIGIFIYRPFCKWLCPLGAFYSFFNKFSLYRYTFDADKCTGCKACEKICKMGVKPYYDANDLECIRCGECISVCKENAIKRTISFKEEYYSDKKTNI